MRSACLRWTTFRTLCYLRIVEACCLNNLAVAAGCRFHVPVRICGCGSLIIGCNNTFGFLQAPRKGSGEILLQPRHSQSEIKIGVHNIFSNNVSIIAVVSVEIGDDCLIGDGVMIVDCDFHGVEKDERRTAGLSQPVKIGNNVWVGSNATILKGVTIGDNAVSGAMSVVCHDVSADVVVAGNPARFLKQIGSCDIDD